MVPEWLGIEATNRRVTIPDGPVTVSTGWFEGGGGYGQRLPDSCVVRRTVIVTRATRDEQLKQ